MEILSVLFVLLVVLFLVVGCFIIYFIPTILAFSRLNSGISIFLVFIINFLFWATLIGWLFALLLVYILDDSRVESLEEKIRREVKDAMDSERKRYKR